MDYTNSKELFEQLEEHLKASEQSWLLGAGISFSANIPLMLPLTEKIKEKLNASEPKSYEEILEPLFEELPEKSHIEHLLSHLGDYAALASRNKNKEVKVNDKTISLDKLEKIHNKILQQISNIIRYGYDSENKRLGTVEEPLVKVSAHQAFVEALFSISSAGIAERKNVINFFTTNYDTLLEDALALNKVPYWDGFSGGAVAYRTQKYGEQIPAYSQRANLVKLHGSIDWYLCEKGYVWRVRDKDIYPTRNQQVLIYPQATKYIATQQDPFASQFDLFRKSLNSANSNVLFACGYSFGDEHINNEIEFALSKQENKTVLLAFTEAKGCIPECLDKWRKEEQYGKRIYIITPQGLYVGANEPVIRKENDTWWTFEGVTELLKNGCEV